MTGEMKDQVKEPYGVIGNNCGDLVHDSLKAGGVDTKQVGRVERSDTRRS